MAKKNNIENISPNDFPYNIEAEKAILGMILINQEVFDRVVVELSAEDFCQTEHKLIFNSMISLYADKNNINIITVMQELRKFGKYEKGLTSEYITSLTNKVPNKVYLEHYTQLIKDNSIKRKLINISTTSDQIFNKAEKNILNPIEREESKYLKSIESIKDVLPEVFNKILKMMNNSDILTGILSGFDCIDNITNGFQNSNLVVLGARYAIGKSALAISFLANIAIREKIPVGYFSLKLPIKTIILRLLSSNLKIKTNLLKNGYFTTQKYEQLNILIGKIYDSPIFFEHSYNLNIVDLCSEARKMVNEYGVKIIFIDYLNLVQSENKTISRQEQIAEISRSLKALAIGLDIPIIILTQLNGEEESPGLADFGEAFAIEKDADLFMFLHREVKSSSSDFNSDLCTAAKLIIAKHRNDSIGEVDLDFYPSYARFESKKIIKK